MIVPWQAWSHRLEPEGRKWIQSSSDNPIRVRAGGNDRFPYTLPGERGTMWTFLKGPTRVTISDAPILKNTVMGKCVWSLKSSTLFKCTGWHPTLQSMRRSFHLRDFYSVLEPFGCKACRFPLRFRIADMCIPQMSRTVMTKKQMITKSRCSSSWHKEWTTKRPQRVGVTFSAFFGPKNIGCRKELNWKRPSGRHRRRDRWSTTIPLERRKRYWTAQAIFFFLILYLIYAHETFRAQWKNGQKGLKINFTTVSVNDR
jgi:hypothetical protein